MRLLIKDVQRAVAAAYKVNRHDLIGHTSRYKYVMLPRHIAMYLCYTLTRQGYNYIAKRFDGRHHTTVMHACRKIERLIQTNAAISHQVELLATKLREREHHDQDSSQYAGYADRQQRADVAAAHHH